jgi:hypothetical protein
MVKNTLVWNHKPFVRLDSKVQKKPKFISGLTLNRLFYREIIKPIMAKYFPSLRYSCALTGHGSDVLGFDSSKSMDHNWGPHVVIFIKYNDYFLWSSRIDECLRKCLPYTFRGFSVNFSKEDPNAYLKQVPEYIAEGDVNHLCTIFSIRGFLRHYLGFDRDTKVGLYDWLTFPEQNLLEVTAGEVYYDGLGELIKMRKLFKYYPNDIWIYAMRVQWLKFANELSFHARSGEVGDELGSRVLAFRSIEKIMKMCFLMERQYAPYLKWLGSGFIRLKYGKKLMPIFKKINKSLDWKKRQHYLSQALASLGQIHNSLKITRPIPIEYNSFPGRNFKVFNVDVFLKELENNIKDSKLKQMKYVLGTIDQFIDHAKIGHENYVYRHMQDLIE